MRDSYISACWPVYAWKSQTTNTKTLPFKGDLEFTKEIKPSGH